ncbi:unnamed protein product [Camellia sinensis]
MIIPSSSSSLSSSSSADQQMTTTSHHHFGNPSKNLETFSITIIESMKEEYGLFVWPCSVVLAEYVWQQISCFSGVSVIKVFWSWNFFARVGCRESGFGRHTNR